MANWEGKYSSFAGLDLSVYEAAQPAALTAAKRGWRPAFRYISSLVLSRFSCGHPFCLVSCYSDSRFFELRLSTREDSGAGTLLV